MRKKILYMLVKCFPLLTSFSTSGLVERCLEKGNAIGIVLFSLALLISIFLFRRWIRSYKTSIYYRRIYIFLYIVIYIVLYVLILVLCRLLKMSICPYFIGLLVLHMTDDSAVSSASESSFELQVLLEPWPDEPGQVQRNLSQETSLRQRVLVFGNGNEESPFLMGKTSFAFFQEVEENLQSASTQKEYNWILDFENRDLQIRERKRECYLLFDGLSQGELIPGSREHASARDYFMSFLDIKREQVEAELKNCQPGGVYIHPRLIDQMEKNSLNQMAQDLHSQGRNSASFTQLKEFCLAGPGLW
jgi:hypothetical protein